MKKCQSCNLAFDDTKKYCNKCGKPLTTIEETFSSKAQEPSALKTQQPPHKSRKLKIGIAVGSLIVVLIGGFVFINFHLCGNSRRKIVEVKRSSLSNSVNDSASVLSPEVKDSIKYLSQSLFEKTGVSLVLVTLLDLEGKNIDNVANRLFAKLAIGKKGTTTGEGILLLVAVHDRAIRIETGYGSEGYITDVQAKRIIQEVAAPFLSKGKWDDGLKTTMLVLADLVAKAHNISLNNIVPWENVLSAKLP
jgi:uncharacterized membrane protein YgcG